MNATETRTYCDCHSIREGSGGVTFSYAILGVLCPSCDAAMAADEEADRRERLSPEEREAEDAAWRAYQAEKEALDAEEPPF